MEPEVTEIPPPIRRISKILKRKEPIMHEVIDLDVDNEFGGVMYTDEKYNTSNKEKGLKISSSGYSHRQVKEALDCAFDPDVEILGATDHGVGSKNYASTSHNFIDLDDCSSDLSYDADECMDHFSDGFKDADKYSIIQASFDNVDIPSDVEASIPWLSDPTTNSDIPASGSPFFFADCLQSDPFTSMDFLPLPSWSQGHDIQVQLNSMSHLPVVDQSLSCLPSEFGKGKKKATSFRFMDKSGPSSHRGSSCKNRRQQTVSNGSNNFTQLDTLNFHPKNMSSSDISIPSPINISNHFHGAGPPSIMTWWGESFKPKMPSFINHGFPSGFYDPFNSLHAPPVNMTWVPDYSQNQESAAASSTTSTEATQSRDLDEISRNFERFKQFDTVEDHSDHHYTGNASTLRQPSKNWAKRIQEEWKILEKDLPDTIFVRVYETRMDLLRAVIVGAEGTPYHDGLFFFDVNFPSTYPSVPPKVHYHSGGLRLNPNLYHCGKVCLSLLNTWSGRKEEKWIPGVSTMLQVLVSIQGLILNSKPYFNEPGYERMNGSAAGEKSSQKYNEDTFISSLKTMTYSMRRPPKYFEDLVLGHFCKRAHDILVACRSYMDGAQVGSLVKGGVQDINASHESCPNFKSSLSLCTDLLVKEFTRIGAKD